MVIYLDRLHHTHSHRIQAFVWRGYSCNAVEYVSSIMLSIKDIGQYFTRSLLLVWVCICLYPWTLNKELLR